MTAITVVPLMRLRDPEQNEESLLSHKRHNKKMLMYDLAVLHIIFNVLKTLSNKASQAQWCT